MFLSSEKKTSLTDTLKQGRLYETNQIMQSNNILIPTSSSTGTSSDSFSTKPTLPSTTTTKQNPSTPLKFVPFPSNIFLPNSSPVFKTPVPPSALIPNTISILNFRGRSTPKKEEIPKPNITMSTPPVNCGCQICTREVTTDPNCTWRDALVTVLKVMSAQYKRTHFTLKGEILEFIDSHWSKLWNREKRKNWDSTVRWILHKHSGIVFELEVQTISNEITDKWGLLQHKKVIPPPNPALHFPLGDFERKRKLEAIQVATPEPVRAEPPKKIDPEGDLKTLAWIACFMSSTEKEPQLLTKSPVQFGATKSSATTQLDKDKQFELHEENADNPKKLAKFLQHGS